jgi:hypothetical protein
VCASPTCRMCYGKPAENCNCFNWNPVSPLQASRNALKIVIKAMNRTAQRTESLHRILFRRSNRFLIYIPVGAPFTRMRLRVAYVRVYKLGTHDMNITYIVYSLFYYQQLLITIFRLFKWTSSVVMLNTHMVQI